MDGLFTRSQLTGSRPLPLVARCGLCQLYKDPTCKSPKMPVDGEGRKKILIVGEAPGHTEDQQNRPFVGNAGDKLWGCASQVGLERNDCWIINSLICWPHERDGKNRAPTDEEIGHCRANVVNAIKEYQPHVTLLLGKSAIKSVLVPFWKNDLGELERWVGWRIPSHEYNSWLCPTWHPSHLLYEPRPVRDLWFTCHLKAAVEQAERGRPWQTSPPDFKAQVQIVVDPDEAAGKIERLLRVHNNDEVPVAFDYETDRLKPDHPDSQIVSCSMSDGTTTFAYPWLGEAIKWTGRFLRSRLRKIASNLKFEERWTLRHFGFGVENWDWDTMLAAHWLDNRSHITSIKFQAFVLLGVVGYEEHIAPYLESGREQGCNTKNRIRELDLRELLLYNGLDSLLEWHVARRQKRMGRVK